MEGLNIRRARRVKCDETHPACKRCQKLHVCCSYPVAIEKPKQGTTHRSVNLHTLIPKANLCRPAFSLSKSEVRAGPRFTDEMEARYFLYYCEEVSIQIGGPFQSQLWDQLIPQAGEEVPFIGRAVIALGALSLSQSLTSKSPRASMRDLQEKEKHRRYALTQYVRALQGMRKSIKDHPSDVRTALIGCLLVFCFESLQGHQAAASAHASSGSNLIMNMSASPCRPKSWRESELGRELYAAFSALNLQSLLFADRWPGESHGWCKRRLSEAARAMPGEFTALEECTRYWHYMMRRNLHFSLEVRGSLPLSVQAHAVPASLLAERDLYVRDICRWEIASAVLLCRHFARPCEESNLETEDFLVACLLRIHAAMNIVLLTHVFNPPETVYSKFSSQFRTIVELSERVQPLLVGNRSEDQALGGDSRGTFRFEVGILPALSQVCLLCRDRQFRDRAVQLLKKSKGYREGIWDAEAVGAVGEWVRGAEEEDMDGEEGQVDEGRMVQLVACDMKVEERWAKVLVRQADSVEREGVVRW
jgi:Fungal Zn(2)-Cys(6) binuclear cluster domain